MPNKQSDNLFSLLNNVKSKPNEPLFNTSEMSFWLWKDCDFAPFCAASWLRKISTGSCRISFKNKKERTADYNDANHEVYAILVHKKKIISISNHSELLEQCLPPLSAHNFLITW